MFCLHYLFSMTSFMNDSSDPLALPIGGGGYPGETTQYKLCICGTTGKIFAVPIKSKLKDPKSASGIACLQTFNDQPHPCTIEEWFYIVAINLLSGIGTDWLKSFQKAPK